MAVKDLLLEIDELQRKINSFGNLDSETLKKINYKFRLDWNYHSNAIEGGSLTKEETRSVMVNNVTLEGKPLKDVIEMRGHDNVISDILKIGKGELRLSEKRIKDIHKAIMHEESSDRQDKVGKWKTESNYLTNYKDEKYSFVAPADVPEKMHELLNELNAHVDSIFKNKERNYNLHPAIVAFQFHLAYVTIHPFYDGNGRTARILMNLILISFGFPPVIIKTTDKNKYNQYLADIQAYGGNTDLYFEFMCKLLIKSQELVLTAIEGGNIDDKDDLDKKLLLLEKELSAIDPENDVKDRFSTTVFTKMYESWISELLKTCIPVIQKFNKFFTGTNHYISGGNISVPFIDEPAEEIVEKFREELARNIGQFNVHQTTFRFSTHYGTLIKGGLKTFGCNYSFTIKFDYTFYSISVDEFTEENNSQVEFLKARLLHQPLTKKEMEKLTKMLSDAIFQHIDFNTKKNGIR